MATTDPKRYQQVGLFTGPESRQLDDLIGLVSTYLARAEPERPLSIAVFGAPGSGKSRLVRLLKDQLPDGGGSLAKLAQINLTQLSSTAEVADAVLKAKSNSANKVPFIFFDEFDAKLDGAPWGWLSWFLAPMQDGALLCGGAPVELRRAVYVFAGGTASSFERFGENDPAAFRFAKGPDFVSRLRGYVNIPGVNADTERIARRQAVLDHLLRGRTNISTDLRTAMLRVGRYRHGARSMEALVEMMPSAISSVTIEDVRDLPLLSMHVDRGPLDPTVIGGCIGISGSDIGATEFGVAWEAISEALFHDGAALACGGRSAARGLQLLLEKILEGQPRRLEPSGNRWLVISRSDELLSQAAVRTPPDERLEIIARPSVADNESPSGLTEDERVRWREALAQFRMRYQLTLRCVARFAIGGRLDAPEKPGSKRFPGVVEELMLALAMGQPVYVAGRFGGGAAWAGTHLALGHTWSGPAANFSREGISVPPSHAALFRPPPLRDLPLTYPELVKFFEERALGSPGWIPNGLGVEENRELFETDDVSRIATLVRRGLRARLSAQD